MQPLSSSTVVLPRKIAGLVDRFNGQIYFAAENLSTGESLTYRADEQVQTASVIKLPIMMEVFAQVREGRLDFGKTLTLDDSARAPGAGILQDLSDGLRFSLKDAVTLMIVLSDNTATNLVIDEVGIEAVNRRLQSLGLRHTYLNKKVFRPSPPGLPEDRARFGLGVTTAGEMLDLLKRLHRGELVDAEASREMIQILEKQRDLEQIPRYLTGPDWNGVKVANKTGALDRVRNDVGLVFTPWGDFALSLFAQESEDQKWTPDNQGSLCLAGLARAILEHFRHAAQDQPASPASGEKPAESRQLN